MNNDDDYDPRELPTDRREQSRRVAQRLRNTSQDARLPLLSMLWDWWQGSETAKRGRLRNVGRTLDTEAEYLEKQRNVTKQKRKLVGEETELVKTKRQDTIENWDNADAIDFEREKRKKEREDYFDDRRMKRERLDAKHQQKMNPRRGKGKYERLKDSYRNYQTYGSDGVHMKAWKEIFDEAVEKYGSEKDIPPDEYDNLMRGRKDALKRDNSQG